MGKNRLLFGLFLFLAFILAGCSSNQPSTLPPVQQSPNAPVPTTSTQMVLPTDTGLPPAAPTEGTEPAVAETKKESSGDVARPSNPGGPGQAVSLTGNPTDGQTVFNNTCAACHGPSGTKGIDNTGSNDGSVPPLNPIDPTLANADPKVFAENVDLFIEHGSTPVGPNPAVKMPAFGDNKQLTPQQIADVISYVISLNASPAASGTQASQPSAAPSGSPAAGATEPPETPVPETQEAAGDVARPSNPGGPGQAVSLTGNAASGETTFSGICTPCHGPQGTKGMDNPGSNDGSVPPINPIDETMVNPDPKVFAENIDLFLEHGSTPEGANPTVKMPAFGDSKMLTPQQIADVIAYVISLNTKK